MKINKYQKKVNSGIIDLELIDGEKVLDVMYLNNFDVYWSFVALNADNMEFEIPKEHYSLYQLFKKLYDDMINFNKLENAKYGVRPIEDDRIKWYSDEADYEEADCVEIINETDLIRLKFESCKNRKICTIRFRSSGSRYGEFNVFVRDFYNRINTLETDEQQMSIDEYQYIKKRK